VCFPAVEHERRRGVLQGAIAPANDASPRIAADTEI
jgi:hypothetical protein